MMKKLIALALSTTLLIGTLAGCATKTESDGPTYTLRFGHTLTEQDTFHNSMVTWAEEVAEKTDGDFVIEIYPNAELGSEEDVLEQMRQGANIGWQTDFARAGGYVTELSVMNAPFFVSNLDEVKALSDSESLNGWMDELASDYSLRPVSFQWVQGNRVVYSNKMATNPEEMTAMSVRAANAPIWLESVNALGCTPVALAYGDMYSSIETKVVDGCELPYNAALSLKINEVCDYIIETNHIYQMNLMLVGEEFWNSLPEEYQTIMVEACNNAGIEASNELAASADASKQALIDGGMELIAHDELDLDAFIADSQKAYDALGLADARSAVYAEIGKN